MINAQQYLNQNYSKEITELNLANQNLADSLIIQDFPNLEIIKCGNNPLTSIELLNLPKLNYFHTNNCQIIEITVNNCPNISEFNIANNLLTNTNFLNNLNPKKLTHLSIHSNNFQKQDLSFLSQFINLEKLFLDNHGQEKLNQNIYNRFHGSLQPLQNLTNLKWLNVANTDIDSGLEYLPEGFKKICLINSWERKNAGYLDLKWEIEKSVRFPRVTGKIQQIEEGEPPFVKNWCRIAPWREAREKYGKEIFERHKAQEWLEQNYPSHTNRQYYKEMVMSDKNLKGVLDLSDFASLEKLDCSYNLLTNLDLSKCENLIELNCSNNQFINIDFLSKIPKKEKIEKLNLSNNSELKANLNFLSPFTNLKELDINNCPFEGSLKPLEKAERLRKISLADTNIDSGLDYLSDNCRELYCDPDTKKKSVKIANILTKYLEERNKQKCYNLIKWREDWRNNIISSIPTERLFVIRGNIKKFVNKWSKEADRNWYEMWKSSNSKVNRLDELKRPKDFSKQRWLTRGVQWTNRTISVVGGSLLLISSSDSNDSNSSRYNQTGGVIAIAAPFIETVTSYINEKFYDVKQEEWEEFINDAENMLDSYHELLGILEPLEGYKLGEVNKALENLKDKTNKFLEEYDEVDEVTGRKNGVIDIPELTESVARKKFARDLSNEKPEGGGSQLGDIVQAIMELEKEIGHYRRDFYYGLNEEVKNGLEKSVEVLETDKKEEYQAKQEVTVDLDKYFQKQ